MDSKFEVVISGISGKFPECEDVPSFKDALYKEKNLLTQKDERWPINYKYKYSDQILPAATGKIRAIKEMDIGVFKINNAIAECTSASNRGVLEPAFEAVMDAGINPHDLSGKCIAVYAAAHHCDTDQNAASLGEGRLWMVGSGKTMMANRISFAFNLTGPSETIYHDINGSFLALHEGYKMVSEGHAEAAIIGIVSTALFPNFSINLSTLNFLSSDSMTRVFDKNASGYGRSDAIVALFLQRAEDAKRIYSTIDFSGYTYHGSNPNSLLGYDENLLKASLLDMYSEKNYKGYKDVAFVEMHACGLKRNDRIECNAIADVLCEGKKTPLLVGSVKSNVGNTEGAAPYVGLFKVIFAFETGSLLHNINLDQIDNDIEAFARKKLKAITKLTELPSDKIAINSVGFTGSLSQLIVKRNPNTKTNEEPKDNLPRIILICGRTEDGMRSTITKLEQEYFNINFISLVNDVFGTDMPFHTFRGYTIVSPNPTRSKMNAIDVKGNRDRPIWFLFSGMGSQWNLMGNGLLDVPIFAETVQKCHDILKPRGIDIFHILSTDDPTIFDNIVHAFVGIITIQIGLVEILKALGIKADGIIGHSVGENACAYADGCLSLEQAVLSSYARGLASIETETIKGMMAAIGKGYNEIKDSLPPNIEVACHNSSASCTISGPAEDVNKFVQHLQEQKVFAKAVNVANIAYHSKYIAPAAPNLLARLQEIIQIPTERSSKWISTSVPESRWQQPLSKYCSAEYLTNNLLSPVLFEEGCKHIPSEALVIEIAPHGLLQAILKRSLPDTCTNVSLTRRNNENKNLENLLTAIGRLYISGCNVNANAIYPPIQYPVPRNTPSVAPFAIWHHTSPDAGVFKFDSIGSCPSDPITIHVNDDSPYFYLKYHQINNQIVFPTSLFLYVTWWVFSIQHKQQLGSKSIIFRNIHLFKNVDASSIKPRTFTIYIQKGSGTFEILKLSKSNEYKSTKVMTGIIFQAENDPEPNTGNKNELPTSKYTITGEQFYNFFTQAGYKLKNSFSCLQQLTYNKKDCYGSIEWNHNWVSFIDALLKFSMFRQMNKKNNLLYTKTIRELIISPPQMQCIEKGSTLICHQDFTTNDIKCDGIYISGIQNDYFKDMRNHTIANLEGLQFISYRNPNCQNMNEFLGVCLQIASDTGVTTTKGNDTKLNVVMENENIAKSLKAILKNNSSLKSKIVFRKEKELFSEDQFMMNSCLLVIGDNIEKIRKYSMGSISLLLFYSNDQSIITELEKSFVEITKQTFGEISICLYKKKLTIKEGKLQTFIDNEDEEVKCTQELIQFETKIIIKKNTNFENLSLMLNNSQNCPNDRRYVFIMDQKMPSNTSLKKQLAQNLPVNVFHNGEWGSYRAILKQPQQMNEDIKRTVCDVLTDIQLESIQIQYISFDSKVEIEDEIYKYGIEYSGIHISGERIMGLSLVNKFKPITKPDMNFMWKVPKTWSLEDAVTVPLTYVNAYNIMKMAFETPFTKQYKVMINIGSDGLLGLACITLSLHKNYTIYVIVSNDEEEANIQRKFPQIEQSHIFNRKICNYEIEILRATEGLGVDIVINCLPGIQHINTMFNCAAEFGLCILATIRNVDLATQQDQPYIYFISIFSGGLKECEIRRYRGSLALVIHGKKLSKKLFTVLPHIDKVLEKFDNSNSPTLYRIIDENNGELRMENFSIRNYLPLDIPTLESIGSNLYGNEEFLEVTTSTPRFTDVKNVTPIFIISALGSKPLEGLIANLMSPAFCVVLTNVTSSILETASKLYKSLNRVQSKGGVTLIAETWCSCIAMELRRLLEQDCREYRLFTIEGNPLVWKQRIKTLGPIDSPQFENNLITHVLNNNIQAQNLYSLKSLSDKINTYLSMQNYSSLNVHNLTNVINTIRNGLILASRYEHDEEEVVKNTIALAQQNTRNDEMINFSITSELFIHKEDDYYKFINSRAISRKINDNILHNVWYEKEH